MPLEQVEGTEILRRFVIPLSLPGGISTLL